MDLISSHSPSSSVSPPISPIKVFSQPATTLPPLRNLPVWNRTGLEKNRFIRSITKDSPETTKTEFFLGHVTSIGTQTSPPGTAFGRLAQSHGSELLDRNYHADGNAAAVADKKLYFLQAEHEGVLKKLHVELENLRNKNREMTFKFIMTNKGLSVSPDDKDALEFNQREESSTKTRHISSNPKDPLDRRVDHSKDHVAKEEARRHKSMFRSAGNKSTRSNDELDSHRKPGTRSAKNNQSEQSKGFERNQSNVSVAQQPSYTEESSDGKYSHIMQGDQLIASTSSELMTGKKYSPEDYEEIIKDLKELNAKQATELSNLKGRLLEQKARNEDFNFGSPTRLPKLDFRTASKSAKIHSGMQSKHDIVTLPVLRPILGTKVTNRQRKAQASHVQRQRSNRDLVQKII